MCKTTTNNKNCKPKKETIKRYVFAIFGNQQQHNWNSHIRKPNNKIHYAMGNYKFFCPPTTQSCPSRCERLIKKFSNKVKTCHFLSTIIMNNLHFAITFN